MRVELGNAGELRPTAVALNQEEKRVSDCISQLLCPSVGDREEAATTIQVRGGWSLPQGVAVGVAGNGVGGVSQGLCTHSSISLD